METTRTFSSPAVKSAERKIACKTCNQGLCCTKIENLSVVRGQTTILKNVNLHIHCGELTAIIGANGAGKSTLLKAMIGEYRYSGKISYLDEKNIHTDKPVIGYVPQKLELDNTSPISVFDLFASAQSKRPVWLSHSKVLRKKIINILETVESKHLIDRRIGALSGGELQRVLLALALDPVPDLLFLDEPVTGIDQNGLKIFYELLSKVRQNFDLSIVLVSHDLDMVAQYANRVVFIENKTVAVVGSPEEVFENPQVTERFGYGWVKNLKKEGPLNVCTLHNH